MLLRKFQSSLIRSLTARTSQERLVLVLLTSPECSLCHKFKFQLEPFLQELDKKVRTNGLSCLDAVRYEVSG